MSGFSCSCVCPNCGKSANENTDTKPFAYTSIQCLECGLLIQPTLDYLSLEELNECRSNSELGPLQVLPNQDKSIW